MCFRFSEAMIRVCARRNDPPGWTDAAMRRPAVTRGELVVSSAGERRGSLAHGARTLAEADVGQQAKAKRAGEVLESISSVAHPVAERGPQGPAHPDRERSCFPVAAAG
jgi:hypothetical protein